MEERLRKFARLIEAGSFTKAARELHVSQPALSAAVAKLERELKASLLDRHARPLQPTPAGLLAYETAKDLAVRTDNLALRLSELAAQPVPLAIGMIDSVAELLFEREEGSELLRQEAKVSVVVNNSRYLLHVVERGELDIAFIAEQPKRVGQSLVARPVAIEPLVVVSADKDAAVTTKKLANFIAYDQASNTFRLVQRALRDEGVTIQTSFYSTSPEVILRLVLQQKGVAALPYLMVRPHLKNGKLYRLGSPKHWTIPRPIITVRRRDKELPAALTQLDRQLKILLEKLNSEANA